MRKIIPALALAGFVATPALANDVAEDDTSVEAPARARMTVAAPMDMTIDLTMDALPELDVTIDGFRPPEPREAPVADANATNIPDAEPAFALEGGVSLVSDYRFRGVSYSGKSPAIQPELTLSHRSGLYASLWGSKALVKGNDDAEVDLMFGFAPEVAGFETNLAAAYYMYPGLSGANYFEFQAGAARSFGPAKIGVNVAYAPAQGALGGADNIFVGTIAEVGLPGTPIALNAGLGVEDGAFGNSKLDWSLGASYDLKLFEVGVTYVDTARTAGLGDANGGLLFSVKRAF